MDQPHQDCLEDELRNALQYLYDPSELRKSQLLPMFGLDDGNSPLTKLRRTLSEAIEALRPESHVPPDAHAWRIYSILTYRYVERLGQREVAADLGLSVRQLRRDEHAALRVLAHHLRHKFNVQLDMTSGTRAPQGTSDASTTERNQELDWLRLTFPSETVSVRTIIESALSTAAPLIASSGVEITYEMPSELAPVVGQLTTARQALLNVLSAAAQVAPGGKIEIRAAAVCGVTELAVHVQCSDGTASPEDQQMSESLAISRQLLELGGGGLRVAEDDANCLITLSLPTAQSQRVSVLVVDDNTDTLQLFRRYLAEDAFDMTSVSKPEQALARAAEVQPDIILLDVMLPGIDGWELLGRLREHPQTQGIPVVICTILPQEKLALALGAAAFLQKPFTRESLYAVLMDLAHPEGRSALPAGPD